MPEHEYRYFSKERKWKTKKLEIIEDDIPENLKLIGTGTGTSLSHCIFEGMLNASNFMERLTALKVEEKDQTAQVLQDELNTLGKPVTYVTISFYEGGENG